MATVITVTSNVPTGTPVSLPFLATGTALTSDAAHKVQAAWYQIDGGDAVNIDSLPQDPNNDRQVFWSFALTGLSGGNHDLSIYARSDDAIGLLDQVIMVALPPPPPPTPPPPPPPPIFPPPFP